ncbi:MAG: glycosyltransferase family 2 protein [Frankiales bacterium]|nr:glycosyltransferase family 2 protein [Frankiales bacterium]
MRRVRLWSGAGAYHRLVLPPRATPAPRVLVVIPAYNEQASVARVVLEVAAALPDADVLVVDDGSQDLTAVRAARAGARVLTLPYNLGVGGAMRTGYLYALRGDYDAVVQVDADGQHDPAAVPRLLEGLLTHNIVVGARFAGTGVYVARGPRRWAMRLLAAGLSRATGTRLTDTTSGFRAADRDAVRLFARHYPAEYLGDTVESLVIAARAGLTVTQVPVDMRVRAAGVASQSPFRATLYLARAVLALGLAGIRSRHALPPVERSDDAAVAERTR